jgi:hypothetical protein
MDDQWSTIPRASVEKGISAQHKQRGGWMAGWILGGDSVVREDREIEIER